MQTNTLMTATFDLQGHRGDRGLLPENTIPAFLHALDLGVTTLEMDTVVNAERHVVVSHDPWMSAKFCFHGDGRKVAEGEERNLRIYAVVKQHRVVEQTTIQSFDPRALEAMHEIDPLISLSLSVDNHDGLITDCPDLGVKVLTGIWQGR